MVVNSVLSPGVRVDVGAVVRDSIIMFDTVIRAGAVVDRAIIDKEVSVGPNAVVGMGADYETPNRQEPGRLNTGITVIGKRAVIPAGVRLGRNVKVNEDVRPTDFGGRRNIPTGGTVEIKRSATDKGKAGATKGHDGEPMSERMSATGGGGR
jgi:glucose-1-phosphate adenylyltransferase